MRVLAWLVALASVQSPAPTPESPSAARNPSPGQIVRIDVIASDPRGRILDTLKPADFDLRDDGVAQPIEGVRLMRAGQEEARFFAIFLDEYHVGRGETDRVREALTRFVDHDLRPRDRLAVMKPLDSLFAIQLTTERDAARAAIQQFEGRRGEYEARNAYERNFMAGTPARIEAARTQVALSAINALAVQLGTVDEGRKALIVLTEGMSRSDRHRGLEYLPTIDTIVRSADRGNVAIYPLDHAGAGADDAGVDTGVDRGIDTGVDTIRGLAGKTAGQAFESDIAAGLRRALDDSSAYYLLTYHAVRPDDGKFHAVHVDVKRPGAQVRSRDGYYAPSPDDTLRAELLARIDHPKPPAPLEPATHVSTLIRPWFGMSRGPDGRTRVTFVWEPVAHVPGERARRLPSRLMLTALAPDNSVLFNGLVMPTGPGTLDASGTPPARAVFDMAPGRLRLRMAIQDAASQTLDSDVRSLSIRDMGTGVSIATPEVMRARNAREFRALDAAAVPVVSREFSRTERLLIRFHAYGPGDDRPQVSARLLSRGGSAMRELPIAGPSSGTAEHEVDVPLAGLAAGEYVIELVVTSAAGNAKDLIDFRVTN
jgi:VWFA-related protein